MLNFKNKQIILGVIISILFIYSISNLMVNKKLHNIQIYLDDQIKLQTENLRDSASVIAQGGASENVGKFIPECEGADQISFDNLLSSLDKGLSKTDLQNLDSLFGKCGRVFSSRRAAMVMEFNQKINNFEQLLLLKSKLGENVEVKSDLEKWKNLAEKEENISNKFLQLVNVQEQIIKALLASDTVSSPDVLSARKRANEILTELSIVIKEISVLRSDLSIP